MKIESQFKKEVLKGIAEAIETQGLSIATIALDTGIPESTLYQYLNGWSFPEFDRFCYLASYLDIDFNELLNYRHRD